MKTQKGNKVLPKFFMISYLEKSRIEGVQMNRCHLFVSFMFFMYMVVLDVRVIMRTLMVNKHCYPLCGISGPVAGS